jgi:translation initiation factor 2B subunit (eIF-2B alpha/beta/delta family)
MLKKGDSFDKIVSDIQSIKIQGATNVAQAGVEAYLKCPTRKCAKKILSTRPTEPLLQNFIARLRKSKDAKKTGKELFSYLDSSRKKIAKEGAKLIENNMKVFTHCHSSSVIEILKEAKRQKKKFHVYTVEVEPLLQGRMTAKELAKSRIKTTIGPDLAAEQLLGKCDLFLFGADAFTKNKIVNKIGTATLCKLAKLHGVPRYCCGSSMKYTDKVRVERRAGREVWKDNKEEIEVVYPAFDKTSWKLVSGVVSEFGVLGAKGFLKKIKNQ